jgi:hypothetical protein
MRSPWLAAFVVALLALFSAPAEAGVNGRSFAGRVNFSQSGPVDVCISFSATGNTGFQFFGFGGVAITYSQVDLFLFSFWTASGGTASWNGGLELFGILAIAGVSDTVAGQGTFIGLPGACSGTAQREPSAPREMSAVDLPRDPGAPRADRPRRACGPIPR